MTSDTSKQTPKLRFPEFRGAEGWDLKPIRDIFNLDVKPEKVTTFNNEKVLTVKLHTHGVIKNERSSTLTGGANYFKRQAGEFIFSKIDLLNGAFGLVPKYLDGFYSSSDVPAFSFKEQSNPNFFLTWMKANYSKLEIERTGTSSTLKRVSPDKFLEILMPIPSLREQQKIADCLGSLDELIGAESQKLEALKTYKKGMMQQLFPAEGETVPKLRFPEFRDAPEWEVKPLGELLLDNPDYGVNASAVPFSEDLPTYLRITDISDEGDFISDKKVSVNIEAVEKDYLYEGDIVFARTGASVGKAYKYRQEDGRLVFAGYLIRVKPDPKKLYANFLFNFLSTQRYWRWINITSSRSGQPGVNGSEFASLPIPVPPTGELGVLSEQQKIGDSLTSIDALISMQRNKLNALKQHKEGLLQQLFPSQEVE